ncbi:hypothetical protein SS50377_24753 [Spironucleus salmonicida]|uniref:Transmembrane protein n=1 Tax=Spironucleus salmonicida TaxID=348837 RepID=V6LJS9_9EUKA|nr:hypothetical protein SS50377_24753 [Spironucleus salmonicida]|eukprot:EST44633.1 Hypothetical protein SS50377_15640 [Spironucleus salmonicida]
MTFDSEVQCQKMCLSVCIHKGDMYNCKSGFTKISLIIDILFVVLLLLTVLLCFRYYDKYKRKIGYKLVRQGCRLKYKFVDNTMFFQNKDILSLEQALKEYQTCKNAEDSLDLV